MAVPALTSTQKLGQNCSQDDVRDTNGKEYGVAMFHSETPPSSFYQRRGQIQLIFEDTITATCRFVYHYFLDPGNNQYILALLRRSSLLVR
jgi:hypothetical protein